MNPRIALTRIGDAFLSLHELRNAERYYQRALELGYDKYAYLGMAKIHMRRGEPEKASDIYAMLQGQEPADARIAEAFKRFTETAAPPCPG
jgi:tetratricopeptide (TPR) repeat protein